MRFKIKAVFLGLITIFLAASFAKADASVEVDGEYRLGLLAGYSVPTGDSSFKDATRPYISGGGLVSKELSSHWAMGFSYDFFDVKDNQKTQDEYRVQVFTVTGIYSFLTESNWTPYVEFGIGAAQTRGPFSQVGIRTAVGIEYFLGPDYSIRAGVHYHFAGKSSPQNEEAHLITPGIMLSRFFGGKNRRELARLKLLEETEPEEEVTEEEPEEQRQDQSDQDKDGIFDFSDQCPNTPKGTLVDINGCPRDSDQDGVIDSYDVCPRTPIGIPVNTMGCPEIKKTEKIELELKVLFEVNSAKIDENFINDIEQIAEMLKEFPSIIAEIQGHTDSSGSHAYNKRLSKRRAESVRKMFIEKYKIEPSRLSTQGFGPDQPIASNQTQAGRAKNRRVIMVFSIQ